MFGKVNKEEEKMPKKFVITIEDEAGKGRVSLDEASKAFSKLGGRLNKLSHYQQVGKKLNDIISLIKDGDITTNKSVEYLLDIQKELRKLGEELELNGSDDD